MSSGIFIYFFPKNTWKIKRKKTGKFNRMKGQGKQNLVKNLHTIINVTGFKQTQTHTNICRHIQCAKVADSFLWCWSKIKGGKGIILLTLGKISGILVLVVTFWKCSWIIWTLLGLLRFDWLPLIKSFAATKYKSSSHIKYP